MDKRKYLSISEAATMLGVAQSTLRRLEKDGKVEGYGLNVYYTPGGQRRYEYNELEHAYQKKGAFGRFGFGKKPCIIVRDLTRYFTDPASKAGYNQDRVIEYTLLLLEQAKKSNIPVIFNYGYYSPESQMWKLWAKKSETITMLVKGSYWTEMDPRVRDYPYFKIIENTFMTPFFQSNLAEVLSELEIDTIIFTGSTTSGVIRFAVIEALQHGFCPIVPKEAVGDRSQVSHQTALLELDAKYADVVTTDSVISYLQSFETVRY